MSPQEKEREGALQTGHGQRAHPGWGDGGEKRGVIVTWLESDWGADDLKSVYNRRKRDGGMMRRDGDRDRRREMEGVGG
ncbi:hypothetical protein PBY51_012291 [Eleginops maclovinus]|uniref:Uncharacterized protein n=1 Tax=Eleginops maclovinus TaxID=56733 RepID=A0AAN7XUW0_ELEMC|nr:hypothetical protein PBY51_012291 [Eleginops maclovinus]